LRTIRKPGSHIGNEGVCGLPVAFPEGPAWHQFRISVGCSPCPNVACDASFCDLWCHLLLLAIAKSPYFINLNPLAGEALERSILEFKTGCTQFHQEFVDSVPSDPDEPGRSTHRASFHQASNYPSPFLCGKLVHEIYLNKMLDIMSSILFK
jgi:hypothetical protein